MQIVTQPQFHPGCCIVCGSPDGAKPWFLDTQFSAEFWGNVYYCSDCYLYMAEIAGFGDVKARDVRILELEEIAQKLYEEVCAYESALASINSLSVPARSFDSSRLYHLDPDSAASIEPTVVGANSSEPDEADGPGEEGPSESVDDEGMDELPTGNPVEFSFE